MAKFIKNNRIFAILAVLAFLTRFAFLSYPAEVVFDEVHFGKFVSAYFTGEYYFDIHPPLGKLMIAGFAKIFGYGGGFDFARIGETFEANSLFALRFLPALFGALFALLIYLLVLKIGLSKKAAFLAGALIIFDNTLLVESKFILVDIFLLFFGFLSFYFFFSAKKFKNYFLNTIFYILSALSVGLALSIKWTSLSFLGIILLFIFLDFLKNLNFATGVEKLRKFGIELAIFTIAPFLIYLSVFAVHLLLLPKAGPGDAFMNQNFQQKPIWQKFTELNQKMYFYSSTLKAGHQDGSRWYEWPFMRKPIWYWTHSENLKQANIYLTGNPLIWWSVLISVAAGLLMVLKKQKMRFYFLLTGFFLNLLPFAGVSRVTFLYHYLPALTFGILTFAVLTEKIFKNNYLYFSFLALVILVFLAISPISYGFSVPQQISQLYSWLIEILH